MKLVLIVVAAIVTAALVAGIYAFAAVFMIALKIAAITSVIVCLGWLYFTLRKKRN